jgi:hypothetical protein
LGTQETFCIVIAGLLERDSFDLFLLEFDKTWVITSGKLAAALQTSTLGGPTLSTRTEACIDINDDGVYALPPSWGVVLENLFRS